MRQSIGKTIMGGLAGTVVMTLMMYFVAPMMTGQKMDIAAMMGSMMGGNWTLGMMAHFANGTIIFPLIYIFLVYNLLPGSPMLRGALWGVVLWLLAQVVVMPMMGSGFFSSQMGGMMVVVASLIGHLVYGGILGCMAGGTEASTS